MRSIKITRRTFLVSLLGSVLTSVDSASADALHPLVGALRWDAWYEPSSSITAAMQASLNPPTYRWRLPFFASISDAAVSFPELSQSLMDVEIAQAAYAGLDFWAFVAYERNSSMSKGLQYYLSSERRDRIKFCMFTALEYWGRLGSISGLVADHLGFFKSPGYVRVFDNRPLYFLGFLSAEKIARLWGATDKLNASIKDFRAMSQQQGTGNPYIVAAGSISDLAAWQAVDADAVSAYAISDVKGIGSFEDLTGVVQRGWERLAQSGMPVVPTIMAGWDRRPRVEHPVPWEKAQIPGAYLQYHFSQPTKDELAKHIRDGLRYASLQPKPAPAVLIYAWNENDEGGWLVPTVPCNMEHLEGLRDALQVSRTENPGCALR